MLEVPLFLRGVRLDHAVVFLLDRIDQPVAVPHLRRHGELALDHRQDARAVDGPCGMLREHPSNRPAALIAHLESGVVEPAHQSLEGAQVRERPEDAGQPPTDGEIGVRVEERVGEQPDVRCRGPLEHGPRARDEIVPGQELHNLRDLQGVRALDARERTLDARTMARSQVPQPLKRRVVDHRYFGRRPPWSPSEPAGPQARGRGRSTRSLSRPRPRRRRRARSGAARPRRGTARRAGWSDTDSSRPWR